MKKTNSDVVVIGGGAAGMLASAVAASRGLTVTVLESQKFCGKKLRITGKGRCNLTNDCDSKVFIKNVPQNGKFLYSALHHFSPADAMALFEGLGVALKTERGRRVFPVSDNAHDVARTLERYMKESSVKVEYTKAEDIITSGKAVRAVKTASGEISCRSVIVCTGGMSYPLTGSTGDGYKFARKLGHNVVEPRASLVPLESNDAFCAEMQGFSLKNVTLKLYDSKNNLIFSELGEMMFTHFGVTGPLVLSASAHMRSFENEKYRLSIDLKPGLSEDKLDARLLRDFQKYSNRELQNALGDIAAKSMIPVLIERSGIAPDTKVNSITREERRALLRLFKEFSVSVSGTRPIGEAIVSSGGVDIREIDPRTMRSKLVEGLYFAGEVLDVDAYTGGFNLQIAWSTGYVAGQSVCAD